MRSFTTMLVIILCQILPSGAGEIGGLLSPLETTRLKSCVEETLRKQGEKVLELPGKAEMIITAYKKVTIAELQEIAQLPEQKAEWVEARSHLQITIAPEAKDGSRLTIRAVILVKGSPIHREGPPYPMGPVGPTDWRPVRSNGTLERKWLRIIQAHCSA